MQKHNTQSQKKWLGMRRRTKIITEYRQTGGDADGDNIVGMEWWWLGEDGYKLFYRVIL